MAFSTSLIAWGVLEFRNAYLASHQIPYVINALRWAADYFLKCHVSPLTFYGQVSFVKTCPQISTNPVSKVGLKMVLGYRLIVAVLKDIAIGAGGCGIEFQTCQIGHSVANGSPPLRCFFGAVLSRRSTAEMDPPLVTRFSVIPRV